MKPLSFFLVAALSIGCATTSEVIKTDDDVGAGTDDVSGDSDTDVDQTFDSTPFDDETGRSGSPGGGPGGSSGGSPGGRPGGSPGGSAGGSPGGSSGGTPGGSSGDSFDSGFNLPGLDTDSFGGLLPDSTDSFGGPIDSTLFDSFTPSTGGPTSPTLGNHPEALFPFP